MRHENLHLIYACPSCKGNLILEDDYESDDREIITGKLICPSENREFVIKDGIPDFVIDEYKNEIEDYLTDTNEFKSLDNPFLDDPQYFLQLPFTDISGMDTEMWITKSEWLEQIIKSVEQFDVQTDSVMIELGAESGWLSHRFAPTYRTLAIDIDTGINALGSAIHFLKEGAHFDRARADMARIPVSDDTADLVIALSSIERCIEHPNLYAELGRILKPGGNVIIGGTPVIEGESVVPIRYNVGIQSASNHYNSRVTPISLKELRRTGDLNWDIAEYEGIGNDRWLNGLRSVFRDKERLFFPLLIGTKPQIKNY